MNHRHRLLWPRVALERPAGSCESCLGKACGGFEGFEGGQTAVLNALKNRWLRVALERVRKRLKHCLGRVAARVALEACGKLRELPWKGFREGLKDLRGLRPGKRQS